MLYPTNLQFKDELESRAAGSTKYIILHHSEVVSPHSVDEVHRWHQNKGWAGIGYHYFISKAGDIYEGRPLNTMGAHTYGYNDNSIGICFEGDFNKEEMGEMQLEAGILLLRQLRQTFPDATIIRHGQLVKRKSCPGRLFPYETMIDQVDGQNATNHD